MKLAVVGSRKWLMPMTVSRVLDGLYPSEVVSGGALGVDSYAAAWARLHLVPCKVFRPDWPRYGRRAGALRNQQIVTYCDKLIAFWDGKSRGTKISIDLAQLAGKLLKIYLE
jgi:hypothetical protein